MIDTVIADKERFLDAMRWLCETFEREPSVGLLRAYALGLAGLSIEEIETAIAAAIARKRFFPRPVELRELVGKAVASERTIQAIAGEAFHVLAETLSRVGTYRSIEFDDPILAAVVEQLGGWVYLGSISESRFNEFTRPAFVKAYVALAASRRSVPPRVLVGINEKTNERPERPVRIATGFEARSIGADPRRFERTVAAGELLPVATRVRLAYLGKDGRA